MSDSIPQKTNENPTATLKKPPNPKPKHQKHVASTKEKLPTPPPDPRRGSHNSLTLPPPKIEHPEPEKSSRTVQEQDREMFEYIESLHKSVQGQYSRSTSTFTPAIMTEEAFDHLEKLYKLMEQMLELREQNARLHRRVQDLEHLNNLEKLQKQLETSANLILEDPDSSELDKDTAFAETILESILQDTAISSTKNKEMQLQYQKQKSVTGTMLKPSILRRHRSGSATEKQVTLDAGDLDTNENIQGILVRRKRDIKQAKISKWTKVKAAFRWEKASNSVAEIQHHPANLKSQDSGIHVPINVEIARYLRVPSTSDDTGHSPVDSGAGISTPGSLSTASSNEDFRHTDFRTHIEDFKSSDDENHSHIPCLKEKHHKGLKTPWAKMKDIIHTRNSFKKKHRLSAASDDIQIDVEFCTDNEDNVFMDDDIKSRGTQISSSPSPNPPSWTFNPKIGSSEIRPEIIERYQRALAEDHSLENDKVSRWSRVRKAFLSSENEDENNENPSSTAEEEIQRSYRKLQKKLSIEFQEKLHEWERLKQSSPSTSTSPATCSILEDNKDPFFMKKMEEWQKIKAGGGQSPTMPSRDRRSIQMTREYELPPEFKKKLQEWEKIKKSANSSKKKLADVPRWKSLSGHRSDTSSSPQQTIEYPVISDDFRKKLEEWKQIKASGGCTSNLGVDNKKTKDKTPSPKLSRKNSSPKQVKKHKEKEIHWVEKELCKIEKEKHRLDRDRTKFLEREERLSKLRRSMTGGTKKDVLIYTPSGFHRFEGISRKFTQKLYEWEKAQGIGPEDSTFALLSASTFTPDVRTITKRHSTSYTPQLVRSKSADSIAMSALNLTCPIMSHQPSSLSLNDVDDLERKCLADSSKGSSMQFLETESQIDLNLDEPEAVLVEVEDYEEETAEPLFQAYIEKHQLPIYQRQEVKTLCEGETVAAPKIERSESTRAQNNYNLIECVMNLLSTLNENETEIKKLFERNSLYEQIQVINDKQKGIVKKIIETLLKLHEANNNVASNIVREEASNSQKNSNINDILDSVQDLSNELVQLAEELEKNVSERNIADAEIEKKFSSAIIFEIVNEIRSRMLELRRHLSYICAASDLTAPIHGRQSKTKIPVHKTLSSESKESRCDTSDNSRTNSQKEKRFIKSDNAANLNSSQGAVKKRIRYRQKSMQQKSVCLADTDDEDVYNTETHTKRQHKKVTRQRSLSENSGMKTETPIIAEQQKKDEVVPTDYSSGHQQQKISNFPTESPVTVFVKTTRKLFTPIAETGLTRRTVEPGSIKEKEIHNDGSTTLITLTDVSSAEQPIIIQDPQNVKSSLPPLPSSPTPQRKVYKDVSPSIRLMMAKYNQKVLEQDAATPKSGGSSGSSSPIWRSPISERRVRAQTERYQEELQKLSPLLGERKEVKKSASASYINSGAKQVTIPIRKTSLQTRNTTTPSGSKTEPKKSLTLDISLAQAPRETHTEDSESTEQVTLRKHSPEIRLKKLQKAKEEFLKAGPQSATTPTQSATCEDALSYPSRNRLSQISVGSESSFDSSSIFCGHLVKSVSAGMINIEAESYKQIDPEFHGGGYVSLPRSPKKTKEGFLSSNKFGFSTIAAKFRKVKMRKGKNSKMDTVATLCRQSLVVDINNQEGEQLNNQENVSNNNNNNGDIIRESVQEENRSHSSPITKSQSWIKRSLFKK